ncbi:MAG: ABC transporter permease/substrate-binding protein [Pseudohongiellaceae bacterium]
MSTNLQEQLQLLPAYFQGHLALTLAALFLGILVSIPLGVVAAQSKRAKQPLLTVISIIQTVPSVAILALVVAMLGGEIGFLPAIIALTLYSMLPIVRNTVTGLETVAAEVVEAAQGLGMSSTQILTKIRIPLAMPVIIAGIRTAAVWTVGLATLSTLVGATSFGNYIFSGLQTRNLVAVTVGSFSAATLAISLDWFIAGIQWLFENRARGIPAPRYKLVRNSVAVAGVAAISLSLIALWPKPKADFIIGGKGFTEQYIVAGLIAAELEKAGFTVEQRLGMGTQVVYEAAVHSRIDAYVEYTGTVWANVMGETDNPGREEVLEQVSRYIEETDQLTNIGAIGFKNLYGFAMTKTRAAELGVTSINDLVPIAGQLVAGGDLEFFGRPEWTTVRDKYAMDFGEKLTFDTTLMYSAVSNGQVDVISAYSTDGRVAAYDLLMLDDPRNALLPYDCFIITSPEANQKPGLVAILNSLVGKISDQAMQEANKIVDVDGGTLSEAITFLQGVIAEP